MGAKKQCIQCGNEFRGRADKKYCSVDCKNIYNYNKRKETQSVTEQIDKILHRNREILSTVMGPKRKRIHIARLELERMGFNFNYITGYYINSAKKTYHYVYDFAWMEFSSQKVMLVREDLK
jgi:predicted nucleic acid-binding Zn ribbon protein